MKSKILVMLSILVAGALSACGSSNPPAAAIDSSGTATVQGLSTPKSVSVVTAN